MKIKLLITALSITSQASAQNAGTPGAALAKPEWVESVEYTTGGTHWMVDGSVVTVADPALEANLLCEYETNNEDARAARYEDYKYIINSLDPADKYILFDGVEYKTKDPLTLLKSGKIILADKKSIDFHVTNFDIVENAGGEYLQIACVTDGKSLYGKGGGDGGLDGPPCGEPDGPPCDGGGFDGPM